MQSSLNRRLTSSIVGTLVIGLLMTLTARALTHPLRFNATFLQATSSTDDDRGSGRLVRHLSPKSHLSFRGSGRVNPDLTRPPGYLHADSKTAYRGSGRLGQETDPA